MQTKIVKEHAESSLRAMAPGEYACEEGTGVVVHRTAVSGKYMINDGKGGFEMVSDAGAAMESVKKRRGQMAGDAKGKAA